MREFLSRIDIDLNKQIKLDQVDIVVKDRLEQNLIDNMPPRPDRTPQMFGQPEDNEFFDPNGQGEEYMGP